MLSRQIWRGGVVVEIERDGALLEAIVAGSVTGGVACVEAVTGLDDDLTSCEEDFAEAELLAACSREAARRAEIVPAYRRCA